MTTTTVSAPRSALLPLVLLAAAVTVLMWASAFVAVRGIGDAFSPGAIALGRQVVGTFVLTLMVAIRAVRQRSSPSIPRGRSLLGVFGWGVLWFALYNLAFNTAEHTLDAGSTSFLVNLAPILVAVLAGLLLREGFPVRLIVGLAIALAGAGVIAFSSAAVHGDLGGVLLGIAAAVLYALGAISQKRLLRTMDGLTMTWLGSAISIFVLLPFLPQFLVAFQTAPAEAVWLIVYLGVGPTAIGFSTWAYVLARVSAGRTAATTYLVPLTVLGMAWVFLGEIPSLIALLGGVLALAGVAVATLRRA
ncbi:DMT family transporter [Microbacterium sp.]|uniref:DMT family transporter n=1 Tax=Microbacterium sp. TaxID=51671 RepID=UPI003C73750B